MTEGYFVVEVVVEELVRALVDKPMTIPHEQVGAGGVDETA